MITKGFKSARFGYDFPNAFHVIKRLEFIPTTEVQNQQGQSIQANSIIELSVYATENAYNLGVEPVGYKTEYLLLSVSEKNNIESVLLNDLMPD